MNDIVSGQFQRIKEHYPDAEITEYPDGVAVLTATVRTLPEGAWNKTETKVLVVVPVGYPVAKPDCFWTEVDLRLHTGAQPTNTAFTAPPHHNVHLLWFSWHISKWNPNKDGLVTYMRTVEGRLREPR